MKRHVQELIYLFIFVAFGFIAASRYLPYLWVAACALGMAVALVFAKLLFVMHHDIHRVMRKVEAEKRRHEAAGETPSIKQDQPGKL